MDTTQWSVVLQAKKGDEVEARQALAALCETYWPPLYAFLRTRGHRREEAEDLGQEFFRAFIEKDYLRTVDRDKGRFRNFLLVAMKHFEANEWQKKNAKKRGGGNSFVSLDVDSAENVIASRLDQSESPEQVFRREWALALLSRALGKLEDQYRSKNKWERFELLRPYISANMAQATFSELEAETGIRADTLKVYAHRLRKQYGEFIRKEIAQTVAKSEDIEEEYRELFDALG